MAKRKHHLKSTAAETLCTHALAAVRAGAETSCYLCRLGLYQAPARILELRRRGYEITTNPTEITDADGFIQERVALYALIAEPKNKEAYATQQ